MEDPPFRSMIFLSKPSFIFAHMSPGVSTCFHIFTDLTGDFDSQRVKRRSPRHKFARGSSGSAGAASLWDATFLGGTLDGSYGCDLAERNPLGSGTTYPPAI